MANTTTAQRSSAISDPPITRGKRLRGKWPSSRRSVSIFLLMEMQTSAMRISAPAVAMPRPPNQPPSFALMRAPTAPMSALPAAFDFTTPMTLPMSLMDAAPVELMASAISASSSASDSCAGR
jgi:hypothetical protein